VGRASAFTRSYLLNANPVSFEKNLLIISFDPEFEDYIGLVDNVRNHTLLQTKLAELGHPNAMVKFIKAETTDGGKRPATTPAPAKSAAPKKAAPAPAATPAENVPAPAAAEKKPAPVAFNKDDFKNDPLIKKALEVFRGAIVEVRA
jgi:DNA polymerase-3 subunit gamma/tau